MKLKVAAALAAGMIAGPALAADGVEVEIVNILNPPGVPGVTHIMVQVSRTAVEPASFVQVNCDAVDNTGAEVGSGDVRMQNLAAGEVRTEPVEIEYDGLIAGAACELEKYIR